MVTAVELADLPAPAWSSFWQLAGAICYPFCPFTPPLPFDWPSGVVGQSLGLSILVALLTLGVSLLWIGSTADNDQIFVTSYVVFSGASGHSWVAHPSGPAGSGALDGRPSRCPGARPFRGLLPTMDRLRRLAGLALQCAAGCANFVSLPG